MAEIRWFEEHRIPIDVLARGAMVAPHIAQEDRALPIARERPYPAGAIRLDPGQPRVRRTKWVTLTGWNTQLGSTAR
jgi:hypothetical protein